MKDWDKELFIRVPKDLFDDPTWNNRKFTKKEAYLDLYFLAHDSPNNKGAIVDIYGYMKKESVITIELPLRVLGLWLLRELSLEILPYAI